MDQILSTFAGMTNGDMYGYMIDYGEGTDENFAGQVSSEFELICTHDPVTVLMNYQVDWEDNQNSQQKRPEDVQVALLADGETIETNAVSEHENWEGYFAQADRDEPLYLFDHGQRIDYRIVQKTVPEYQSETAETFRMPQVDTSGAWNNIAVGDTTFTNSYEPEKAQVSVRTVWQDADDQDGLRPENLKVNITNDAGDAIGTLTLEAEDWTADISDLPAYNGADVEHYHAALAGDEPEGYQVNITEEGIDEFVITATHVPATVDRSGQIFWHDADDADDKRPDEVKVQLYKNYQPSGQTKTITPDASGNWFYDFNDLPKFTAGTLNTWYVLQAPVDEYETTYATGQIDNTYEQDKVQVPYAISWWDDMDRDGVRPDAVTVELFANGTKVDEQTVTATSNWTGSFDNMPKNTTGAVAIAYTIQVKSVPDYNAAINSQDGVFGIAMSHNPATVSIQGRKIWDDASNQDLSRPADVTLRLLADGVEVNSQTVTGTGDTWTYDFGKQLANSHTDNGVASPITYTVVEDSVSGYKTSYSNNTFDVTNTRTPNKVNVQVTTTFDDGSNQDGIRPEKITYKLLKNGTDTGKTIVWTPAENATMSFDDLDENETGKKIIYTLEASGFDANTYAVSINKLSDNTWEATFSHTPSTVDQTVKKVWSDDDNRDGKRVPVTVRLWNDQGTMLGEEVLSDSNKWTYTWTGLDEFRAGKGITYTIDEDVPDGYQKSGKTENGVTTLTNSRATDTTQLDVSLFWKDKGDQDGLRPKTPVEVQLFRKQKGDTKYEPTGSTLTLDANNNWTGTFPDLHKNYQGEAISYKAAITTAIPGYVNVPDRLDDTTLHFDLVHTPAVKDINVSKLWNDGNDQDGIRPDSVLYNLIGQQDDTTVSQATQTLTKADGWAGTVTVPVNHAGKAIDYTVEEIPVADYDESGAIEQNGSWVITNGRTTDTTSINVTVNWDDNDDQDGKRPQDVVFNLNGGSPVNAIPDAMATAATKWKASFTGLQKNANGSAINYTLDAPAVNEYDAPVITGNPTDGFVVTYRHVPELVTIAGTKTWSDNNNNDNKRPASVTIALLKNNVQTATTDTNETGKWKYSFDNLPKYEKGQLIQYTVAEPSLPKGYTSTVAGYDITNSFQPGIMNMPIRIVWDDNNNQDGFRPDEVEVPLLTNGRETHVATVLKDTWRTSIDNLPEYVNKVEQNYEYQAPEVPEYDKSVDTTGAETVITYTHKPLVTSVSGQKTWNDDNNRDGIQPKSIEVQLWTGYQTADKLVDTKTVTADDSWQYEWDNLPQYQQGYRLTYSVKEVVPAGYTETYSGNNITNTYAPQMTSFNVSATFEDANNQDGKRPKSITVTLYADDKEVDSAVLTARGTFKTVFGDLPVYENGKRIKYNIKANDVDDYRLMPVITGRNWRFVYAHDPEMIHISGQKTWNDTNDQDGIRPKTLDVYLLKNGIQEGQPITTDEAAGWKYDFGDLPVYENGQKLTWNTAEAVPAQYAPSHNGFSIANGYTPKTVSVEVNAAFVDNNNQDGIQPDTVQAVLLADGKDTGTTLTLDKSNGFKATVAGLPWKQNGKEVVYTFKAKAEPQGYTASLNKLADRNFQLVFSHTPETITLTTQKVWNDKDNQDGNRPSDVTFTLYANGVQGPSRTLNEAGKWTGQFNGLPKYYDQGKLVKYQIAETVPTGYTPSYADTVITNSYTPKTTSVQAMLTWDDAQNQDGLRPDSVTLELYGNGKKVKTETITEAEQWMHVFKDLALNEKGVAINYEVKATTPKDYKANIAQDANGIWQVTMVHKPFTRDITINKIWNDNNNAMGKRPANVEIELKADGTSIDTVTLNKDNSWSETVSDLPVNKAGAAIAYSIKEAPVANYATSVKDFTVTNTYTPGKTSVNVDKVWQDNANQDGIRPDSVTVKLLANGKDTKKTVTLDAKNGWSGTFSNVDIDDGKALIDYTVEEVPVKGYETEVDGTTITNTHEPETIDLTGKINWNGGKRPENVTIRVYANGKLARSIVVDDSMDWKYELMKLPRFMDGKEIVYTVSMDAIPGFNISADGMDINVEPVKEATNGNAGNGEAADKENSTEADKETANEQNSANETETEEASAGTYSTFVQKRWETPNARTESIQVSLVEDGKVTDQSVNLSSHNNWQATFTGLEPGHTYTAKENLPAGYSNVISGDAETGFVITNIANTTSLRRTGRNWLWLLPVTIPAIWLILFGKRKEEEEEETEEQDAKK